MRAMIFAAGIGSRLGKITKSIPKALVVVNKKPLIEHVIGRLKDTGVTDIIINIHHFADDIIKFVNDNHCFDIKIEFSREKELLNTGGGLKKAAWFFADEKPFIVHNVDILSDINLNSLYDQHCKTDCIATLAVNTRVTKRYLLFNNQDVLIGREIFGKIIPESLNVNHVKYQRQAFLGIHIISPQIFKYFGETSVFSIIDAYLDIVKRGKLVKACVIPYTHWFDLGKPENILEVEEWLVKGKIRD